MALDELPGVRRALRAFGGTEWIHGFGSGAFVEPTVGTIRDWVGSGVSTIAVFTDEGVQGGVLDLLCSESIAQGVRVVVWTTPEHARAWSTWSEYRELRPQLGGVNVERMTDELWALCGGRGE